LQTKFSFGQKVKFVLSIGPILGLVSCASVTDFGNQVLDVAGLGAASSVFQAGDSLVKATQSLTREEEYYLGRAVSARILSIYPEVKNSALQKYINSVGLVVAASSSRPDTFAGYHFSILKSENFNAYAAPGGFIFITEGLLKALPDEDSLANVLAHEVAHVAERHGEKAISTKHMEEAVKGLGDLVGSLTCTEIAQQATVVFGSAVDDVVAHLFEKGYSRDQEAEADREGLFIAYASGYDPARAIAVISLMQSIPNQDGGWLSTHPSTGDRAKQMQELIDENNMQAALDGFDARKRRFHKIVVNS